MHDEFADWYRPCTTGTEKNLTEDLLAARWKGIEKLADDPAILDLVRVTLRRMPLDGGFLGSFRAAFKEMSPPRGQLSQKNGTMAKKVSGGLPGQCFNGLGFFRGRTFVGRRHEDADGGLQHGRRSHGSEYPCKSRIDHRDDDRVRGRGKLIAKLWVHDCGRLDIHLT